MTKMKSNATIQKKKNHASHASHASHVRCESMGDLNGLRYS